MLLPAALFSLWGLWQPIAKAQTVVQENWRGAAEVLTQFAGYRDLIVITTDPMIEFYMPQWTAQIRYSTTLPPILEAAQSHPRLWLVWPTQFQLEESVPELYQWFRKERTLEVFVEPGMRLYVYSAEPGPSLGLLEEMVGFQIPYGLAYSNLIRQAIDQGQAGDVLEMLDRIWAARSAGDALDTTPGSGDAAASLAINTGRVFWDAGQQDTALDILHRAVSMAPDFDEAWASLGLLLEGRGRQEKAIAAYRRALELSPDHFWATYLLAQLLERVEGRQGASWQEVADLAQHAAGLAPGSQEKANSLALLGRAHARMGHVPQACQAFEQALATLREAGAPAESMTEILAEMERVGCPHEP
jgi:tetratricopeptide (TPR) repeat protein